MFCYGVFAGILLQQSPPFWFFCYNVSLLLGALGALKSPRVLSVDSFKGEFLKRYFYDYPWPEYPRYSLGFFVCTSLVFWLGVFTFFVFLGHPKIFLFFCNVLFFGYLL
jgi:hypothetical protein